MGKKRAKVDTSTYSGRLAVRMVKRREELEMSVEDVVAKISRNGWEIGAGAYRHWEASIRQVNWDAIPAICKALRTKPKDLLPPT